MQKKIKRAFKRFIRVERTWPEVRKEFKRRTGIDLTENEISAIAATAKRKIKKALEKEMAI